MKSKSLPYSFMVTAGAVLGMTPARLARFPPAADRHPFGTRTHVMQTVESAPLTSVDEVNIEASKGQIGLYGGGFNRQSGGQRRQRRERALVRAGQHGSRTPFLGKSVRKSSTLKSSH